MTDALITQRLSLRPLHRSDAEDIVALIGDLDVARWLTSVPHPYTPEHAEEFLERVNAGHSAIEHKGRFIGVVSIDKQLGYWLGKPFWGRGFMTEATSAFVNQHFDMGAQDLTSGYLVGNTASAGVLGKLGFKPTEVIESFVTSMGCRCANHQMRLTRDAWEARA